MRGLLWWSSGWDIVFQCWGCRFDLWSGRRDPTCLVAKKLDTRQKHCCDKFIKYFKMAHLLKKNLKLEKQCYLSDLYKFQPMSLSLIIWWDLVKKTAERCPKVAQEIFCKGFGGEDYQVHRLWKRNSSGQFRILEELSKCELSDCSLLYFNISGSSPRTEWKYLWSQSITVVRIQVVQVLLAITQRNEQCICSLSSIYTFNSIFCFIEINYIR